MSTVHTLGPIPPGMNATIAFVLGAWTGIALVAVLVLHRARTIIDTADRFRRVEEDRISQEDAE